MRFGGLKDILKVIPAAGDGYFKGAKMRSEMEQAAADAQYKKSQLEYLNKKSEQDRIAGIADQYAKGISVNEQGVPGFMPEVSDPNSAYYKGRMAQSAFKAAESPARGTQSMKMGDIFAAQGRPLPQGVDPNTPAYAGFGNLLMPPKPGAPQSNAEQKAAYEKEYGVGTSANLTPGQISSGLGQGKNRRIRQDLADREYDLKTGSVSEGIAEKVTRNQGFVESLKRVRDAVAAGKLKTGMGTSILNTIGSIAPGGTEGALKDFAGMSPEEQSLLKDWNESVIDKVVSNAASTFSDRYIQTQKGALPSLSSKKDSFLRSINDLISKEENFAKKLVGNAQKVKAGRASELLSDSGVSAPPSGTDLPQARSAGQSKASKGRSVQDIDAEIAALEAEINKPKGKKK